MTTISRRQMIVQGGAAVAAVALRVHPARAGQTEVDLALVLAVDISRSISADEYRLQLEGYAAAFGSRDVVNAIASGANGAIAVALLEWSKSWIAIEAIGWTLIRDPASAHGLATTIAAIPYRPQSGTSIGAAISSATDLLERVPYRPIRRVIDVSGDGESAYPDLLATARSLAIHKGITINGLPLCDGGNTRIADYYARHVIGGPGAFLVAAQGFRDLADAVRRKLVLEIAGEKTEDGLRGSA